MNLPNTTGPGGSNNSIFQTENQVNITANGQRVSSNNYMIDGVDVNSQTWGGAAVVTPNPDSIKEIHVISNQYSAETGRNSGATVQVVTQSGTNKFHGGGFFQYQDPSLNAYNGFGGISEGGQADPSGKGREQVARIRRAYRRSRRQRPSLLLLLLRGTA